MKKIFTFLVFVGMLFFSQSILGQEWEEVATDHFDNFPTGFTQSDFSKQGYGAETGGSSDKCAYDKNVGSSPTGYVSKAYTLESGFKYKFTYMAKRAYSASCGVTLRYSASSGNGGTDVSSEFTPPKRTGSQAGDSYTSDEITGDDNTYYLKAVVTTGNSNDVKLRIDGFKLERQAIMPVEMISFSGTKFGTKSSLLSWQTATEIDNDYFLVEHSIDGKEFETLAKVQGAGNSLETKSYSYEHTSPAHGMNYYRLRQVDFDGKFTFSNVIAINFDGSDRYRIYPTKIDNELTFATDENLKSKLNYTIVDNLGRTVNSGIIAAGITEYTIDVSNLNTGSYFVVLYNESISETHRFVK